MSRVELVILYRDGIINKTRAVVNKWKFQDSMMGEQYIMFNITSELPIGWAVGDFCVFRGETFTLNYVPSVTQKARNGERQDTYTYENVKFDSYQEELTRCQMLDITPTTEDYIAAFGTNYTGSSRFQLFCGETSVNGKTFTAVCALASKMQANLDRMYKSNGWEILVDTETTYEDASGNEILVTHTDDKVLSFDGNTVADALTEIYNTFNLDYCIIGRSIKIGYRLKNLTSDDENDAFTFGYGSGYPTSDSPNTGLFQIKRISNSQQKIVTRLRAFGSTKNLPYRYYNKAYAQNSPDLSQTLFPTCLQLPDTFIPEGDKSDAEGANTKWGHNKQRDKYLRAVKGDINDSYIDKDDDAENCTEGIREASARWDGTDSNLPEIYPTIEEATYGELRDALVQDQDGRTGTSSFPNYDKNERIDKLLAVGYLSEGTLVDDANKGNGILPESGVRPTGITRSVAIEDTYLTERKSGESDFNSLEGPEQTLFTIQGVSPGKYSMAPTLGSVQFKVKTGIASLLSESSIYIGFILNVNQKDLQSGVVTTIATYKSDAVIASLSPSIIDLPSLPDIVADGVSNVKEISVTSLSDITVTLKPYIGSVYFANLEYITICYSVGNFSGSTEYEPEYTWFSLSDDGNVSDMFHVFVQDMGFDFEACWTDDTPVLAMKSGRCVGREFEIGSDIQKVSYNGKKGYMLTLKRATDSSLNTYYPSQNDPIAPDDYFVLLNIAMPDAYIKMAEVRLLRAATQYLADNSETQFTYQPYIDDIYLQRNVDLMEKAGTPEKSIFWRLYAGLKFTFRGIPDIIKNEDGNIDYTPSLVELTIEKVTISMGDKLTPQVDITLNDDIQQTTLQRLTTSVDRIYNGSLFASGGGGTAANTAAILSILQSEGGKLFLSKKHDDNAKGFIDFEEGINVRKSATVNGETILKKTTTVGNFEKDIHVGIGSRSGMRFMPDGSIIARSLELSESLSVPTMKYNSIEVLSGTRWDSAGKGCVKEIISIDDESHTCTFILDLNDGEPGEFVEGDILRGFWHNIDGTKNATNNSDDKHGNINRAGFMSIYCRVIKTEQVVERVYNDETYYILMNAGYVPKDGDRVLDAGLVTVQVRQFDTSPVTWSPYPEKYSVLSVSGHFGTDHPERQNFFVYTTTYMARFQGVNTWEWEDHTFMGGWGDLTGFSMMELGDDGETIYRKEFKGEGFVTKDAHIYGVLDQFTRFSDYIEVYLSYPDGSIAQGEEIRAEFILKDIEGNIISGGYGMSISRQSGNAEADAAWDEAIRQQYPDGIQQALYFRYSDVPEHGAVFVVSASRKVNTPEGEDTYRTTASFVLSRATIQEDFKGEWNQSTTYTRTGRTYPTVTWGGCKWYLVEETSTGDEPYPGSSVWKMMYGVSDLEIRFYNISGQRIMSSQQVPGNVDLYLDPHLFCGNFDITESLNDDDWSWERYTGNYTGLGDDRTDAERQSDTGWPALHWKEKVPTRQIRIINEDMPPTWGSGPIVNFIITANYDGLEIPNIVTI